MLYKDTPKFEQLMYYYSSTGIKRKQADAYIKKLGRAQSWQYNSGNRIYNRHDKAIKHTYYIF